MREYERERMGWRQSERTRDGREEGEGESEREWDEGSLKGEMGK